jgi:hypothetical protein
MSSTAEKPPPRSPRVRTLIRCFAAGAALLLLAAWCVWRFGYDGADPRLIFWPRPPEAAEPAALDEIVSLHVHNRPLRDVLAELADKHDVPIELDAAALKNVGIPVNTQVSIDLDGVTLRTALWLLVWKDLGLIVVEREGGLLVTEPQYYEATLGNYVSRVHRLDALLAEDGGVPEPELAEAIKSLIAPWAWTDVGDGGDVEALPGALVVKQLPATQRQVQEFLDALARLSANPASSSRSRLAFPRACCRGASGCWRRSTSPANCTQPRQNWATCWRS